MRFYRAKEPYHNYQKVMLFLAVLQSFVGLLPGKQDFVTTKKNNLNIFKYVRALVVNDSFWNSVPAVLRPAQKVLSFEFGVVTRDSLREKLRELTALPKEPKEEDESHT